MRSSQSSQPRIVAAAVIATVHVGVGYALMNLHGREPIAELNAPVAVRFITEPPTRPQWDPPKVNPFQPRLDPPTPAVPVIDIPVSQEPSTHAITIPVAAAP